MAQVLVVDDDADIRETLRAVCEDEGHTVLVVPDGATALRMLQTHAERWVVLLDLVMPQVDGVAVLEALHAQPAVAARHAVLLFTASDQHREREPLATLLRALAVPVLRKPVDIDALLTAVREAEGRLAPHGAPGPPPADDGQGGPPGA
jgi:CheY-like chemotaxis protein